MEIIVDRLLREFKVEANVGKPQVSYRETIRKAVNIEHKYARQSGGKGQYGHVLLKLEPLGSRAKATNLSMQLSAVLFRRNIFLRLTQVFRAQCSPVYWQVITLLT